MSERHVLVEYPQLKVKRIIFDRDDDTQLSLSLILGDASNFNNLFRFLTDVEVLDEI